MLLGHLCSLSEETVLRSRIVEEEVRVGQFLSRHGSISVRVLTSLAYATTLILHHWLQERVVHATLVLIVELLVLVRKPLHRAHMLKVCLVNVVWRTISWIELLHGVGQAWHPVRLSHSYQRVLAHTLPAKLVVQALHRLTVHEKLRVSLPIVEP